MPIDLNFEDTMEYGSGGSCVLQVLPSLKKVYWECFLSWHIEDNLRLYILLIEARYIDWRPVVFLASWYVYVGEIDVTDSYSCVDYFRPSRAIGLSIPFNDFLFN